MINLWKVQNSNKFRCKQVVMLQKTPKNYSYNPTITTWAWLQIFVMLALENKSQAAGRITIPGTAVPKISATDPSKLSKTPTHIIPVPTKPPWGTSVERVLADPDASGLTPQRPNGSGLRDRRETSLPQIPALMEPPERATRTANHRLMIPTQHMGVSLRLCDPSFYRVWPYLCRIGKYFRGTKVYASWGWYQPIRNSLVSSGSWPVRDSQISPCFN